LSSTTEVEFKEFFRIFIKNLIIEIINLNLEKNTNLSNKDKEEVLKKVHDKLIPVIEEIVEELEKENLLKPDILEDETKVYKVRKIIIEILRRYFRIES